MSNTPVTLDAMYDGFPVHITLPQDDFKTAIETIPRVITYLKGLGFEAPKPVEVNVSGGRGGGGQPSKFELDVERHRILLFPAYPLVKDKETREQWFVRVAEALGQPSLRLTFVHKDAEQNTTGKYHYWLPLKYARRMYAASEFANWQKVDLPEDYDYLDSE